MKSLPISASTCSTLARNAARGLVIGSLCYAAWRFGATEAAALRDISLALGVASILTLSCRKQSLAPSPLPKPYFALILVWIVYAFLQASVAPSWLPFAFGGVVESQQHFGSDPAVLLSGAENIISADTVKRFDASASVITEQTWQATVPFLLAFAAAVLSAVLFNTSKSRRAFLWAVIVNASALACWGIIQKAGGGKAILPGVENTYTDAMPFASFIYKNAGAAALLPALAAVAAILYARSGRQSASDGSKLPVKSILLDTQKLALIGLAILISVGLIASLSRGAWCAAVLAVVVAGVAIRVRIGRRENLLLTAFMGVAMLLIVGLAGIGTSIKGRASQLSLSHVSLDQRWSQWQDGFRTAVAHFPSGSGLGTYGYATLPHQASTHRSWFREAHNQYLEVFTESGVIGLLLAAAGMTWLATVSWKLMRRRIDRDRRCWGMMGIALLVCGGFQSLFDFVLLIPANMLLYASLIGILGATERATRRRRVAISPPSTSFLATLLAKFQDSRPLRLPAAYLAVALLLLVASYRLADREAFGDRVLDNTRVADSDQEPSAEEVATCLSHLDAAIERQPHRATLYRRRSTWHLVAYRLAILESTRSERNLIGWDNTRVENLFVAISTTPPSYRGRLMDGLLRTDAMRHHVSEATSDLVSALTLNPLSPDTHLACAVLAPLAGAPLKPWLDTSAKLSNNSSKKLYLNGLFSFYADETELAIDQWTKSLTINHEHLNSILEIAPRKVSADRIVKDLIPSSRPDLCFAMVLSTRNEGVDGMPSVDREFSTTVIGHLRSNEAIDSARKHATIARIESVRGEADAAVEEWETALRYSTRDANYRLEYSRSLQQAGRADEALKQSILGQTLNPVDKRFQHLISQLRQEIRLSRRE